MSGNEHEQSRVEEKWAESSEVYSVDGFKVFWEALDLAAAYQIESAFDDRPWLEDILSRIPDAEGKGLRALSLGCSYGEGVAANEFARSGHFREIVVVDISSALLASQKRLTDELGLSEVLDYRRMELGKDSFAADESFDLIFAIGTLHHISGLEQLFAQINRILSATGLFCMREYIGPNRLQFTDRQTGIATELLRALPERLRTDNRGHVQATAWRPTAEEVIADDPSESIRSSELLGVAGESLAVEEIRFTGGSLLDPLLHGIAGNFESDPGGREILPLLIAFEKILVREGVLDNDYAFVFARRRGPLDRAIE